MAASGLPVVKRNKTDLRSGRSRFKSEIIRWVVWIYEHGICNQRMSIFSQSLPIFKIVRVRNARVVFVAGKEFGFCPFRTPVQVVVHKKPAGTVIEAQPFAVVGLHCAVSEINDVMREGER